MSQAAPRPTWDQLSAEERRAALLRLLAERGASPPAPPPEPASDLPQAEEDPAHAGDPYPLTDIQHAYWIGRSGLVELGDVGAHIYVEVEIPTIEVDRLSRAWQVLVRRHGALRTTVGPDGQQRVAAEVPEFWIPAEDLRDLPEAERQERLVSARATLSSRIYTPEQWPLFDLRAYILTAGRTRLVISVDMLILDLHSFQIVLAEWATLFLRPDAALPPLRLSFRDYVIAAGRLPATAAYARDRAWWLNRLPSLPPPPELRWARATPEGPGRFVRRTFTLPAEPWARLKRAIAARRLTPAALLLTLFSAVLARWSGSRHFTVNLTVFNRLALHPDVPRLVGDFTSTDLLEVDLRPDEAMGARAARVQAQLWADLEHRLFGGVRVLREWAREQGGRRVVSPVVFTSHGVQGGDGGLGQGMDVVYGLTQTPQVTLDHQHYERDGALILSWDALEARFPAGVLDDMFEAELSLLRALVEGDEAWNSHGLAPLPAAQIARLAALNHNHAPVSTETLHGLALAAGARDPAALAVVSRGVRLSHGELEARSRALAWELLARGVGPGALVPVVMEKGWEQVVAVLAVNRAGAAWLPIDPDLPRERLIYLLDQREGPVVITQPWLLERLVDAPGIAVLRVEAGPPAPAPPLPARGEAGDLAYVIYTSGSTGQPKGVMIDHRGAVNTILDLNNRFRVCGSDRALGLSALSFDLAVYDVYGLLAAGGAVVLPEPEARRDPQRWLELLRTEGVTLWNSVPALLEMLVEGAPDHEELPHLRLVFLSGDWISLRLARHARATWPRAQLISMGGATEASIWSILYPVTDVDPAWTSVPYGAPMVNQRWYVLDAALEPCPELVPGELCIGGVGLALGYWRRPDLTAERFVLHPQTGERVYRTGDLGVLHPDGQIELLGRLDRQVKIRGHRIELGEIEAALRQDPGVAEVLVVARGDRGRRQLVAYVVPADAAQASASTDSIGQELAEARGSLQPMMIEIKGVSAPVPLLDHPDERARFKAERRGRRAPEGAARVALHPVDLGAALARRRSERRFSLASVSLRALSDLLGGLAHAPGLDRRLHGSAGGLYPVQVHLWVKSDRVEGLDEGPWVYDPYTGELVAVPAEAPLARTAFAAGLTRPMFDEAAFVILLVVELQAIAPLYGELSVHLATLEAGLITQVLEQRAADAGLGLCQVGAIDRVAASAALSLGPSHRLLHTLVGGVLDPDREGASRSATLADLRPEALRRRARQRLVDLGEDPSEARVDRLLAELGLGGGLSARLSALAEARLPEPMRPRAVVLLPRFPLSRNGKVDLDALPDPGDGLAAGRAPSERAPPETPTEATLHQLWVEALGVPSVSVTEDFFAAGGDSVMAIELANRVNRHFRVELPVSLVFSSPTIRALAQNIDLFLEMSDPEQRELGGGGMGLELPVSELVRHVCLPDDVRPSPGASPRPPGQWRVVLLTGATGYFGAHLLKILLQRSDVSVVALARAEDDGAALARIEASASRYNPEFEIDRSRVRAVAGDLSRPRLGLSETVWDELSQGTDAILHAGAVVNFAQPLESLLPTNVGGAVEVLRLAVSGPLKPVHVISTINVFSSTRLVSDQRIGEGQPLAELPTVVGGYAASRWIAEGVVEIARARGLPVSLYRPAIIGCHSVTGVSNPADAVGRLFRGCVELGAAPRLDARLNIVTADYASEAVIALALDAGTLGGTWHLVNPEPSPVAELFAALTQHGYRLQELPYRDWQRLVEAAGPSGALTPLLPIVAHLGVAEAIGIRSPIFLSEGSRAKLEPRGITPPPMRGALLSRALEALVAAGLMPRPS